MATTNRTRRMILVAATALVCTPASAFLNNGYSTTSHNYHLPSWMQQDKHSQN